MHFGQQIALAAVFNEQSKVLLLKRPEDCHCGSLWGLPGGKLEAGESPLEAARRELIEETGITGEGWEKLGECDYSYPDRRIYFHLFGCFGSNEILADRPEVHMWIPVSELGKYPMPEANFDVLNSMVVDSGMDFPILRAKSS